MCIRDSDLPAFGRPMIDANPDRNSVTTLAFLVTTARGVARERRPVYRPMPGLAMVPLVLGASHQKGRNAVPAALRPLGEEPNTPDGRLGPGDRHLPARLGQQARGRVHLVVVDLQVEQLAELV